MIHPQLPLRIPCYDFTPIAGPTLDPGQTNRFGSVDKLLVVKLLRTDFNPINLVTYKLYKLTNLPQVPANLAGASDVTNFRGVTGGVYKTRERIHRSIADLRLLAIPTS